MLADYIIENNATFNFTLIFDRKGTLQIRPVRDEKFKFLMQRGTFEGLDFLKTDFTGYGLFYSSCRRHDRYVSIDNKTKKRIIDKANNGMKYF